MFCSSCGSSADPNLNYCKACGARIKDTDKTEPGRSILSSLLTTVLFVVTFGLGILVGLVAVLLDKGVPYNVVLFIVIGYLASVFGICFMLLGQVKRVLDAKLEKKVEQPAIFVPARIPGSSTAQLPEPSDIGIQSIIEDTTRTLDKQPLPRR